jgi:D-alanyl-D-alanine carboxypeptidase (penicillin-binding protein 5/6)
MTNFVLMYINQENPQYENYIIPGFVAGKSGYTTEGQYTLVSNADINGMNLVMVNAHGYVEPHYPASIEDAATVYNWYNDHFARIIAIGEGESFGTIRVRNAFGRDADVRAVKGVTADLPKDENLHIYVDYPEVLEAPLKKGDKVGTVSVYSYDQLYETVDLVISEDKPRTLLGRFQTALYDYSGGRLWMGILLVALVAASLICVIILIVLTREEHTHRIHRDQA